jgi:tetratricopeptide (TPR) repeat protein
VAASATHAHAHHLQWDLTAKMTAVTFVLNHSYDDADRRAMIDRANTMLTCVDPGMRETSSYYGLLATLLFELKEYDAAERAVGVERAVGASLGLQEHATALTLLATIYNATGRPVLAEQTAERALTLTPGHVGGTNAWANTLMRQNRASEAVAAMTALGRAYPHIPDVLMTLGEVLIRSGHDPARGVDLKAFARQLISGQGARTGTGNAVAVVLAGLQHVTGSRSAGPTPPAIPDAREHAQGRQKIRHGRRGRNLGNACVANVMDVSFGFSAAVVVQFEFEKPGLTCELRYGEIGRQGRVLEKHAAAIRAEQGVFEGNG